MRPFHTPAGAGVPLPHTSVCYHSVNFSLLCHLAMQPRNDPVTSVSFYGYIKDHCRSFCCFCIDITLVSNTALVDALLLITAARFGLIPRFRRRLNTSEQEALIFSGSIFLWTEEESCMKRWTDGYPWSPSRIHHEFLVSRVT